MKRMFLTFAAAVLAVNATLAVAQEEDNPDQAELDRLDNEAQLLAARTKLLKAQADLVAQEAALDKAKVDALGLPSFENKTTLQNGGGELETILLTSVAIDEASTKIAGVLNAAGGGRKLVFLTSEERTSWPQARLTQYLIRAYAWRLSYLDTEVREYPEGRGMGGPESLMNPFLAAAAGLLGQTTTVSKIAVPDKVRDTLSSAVAGQVAKGYSYSQVSLFTETNETFGDFGSLSMAIGDAEALLASQGDEVPEGKKARIEALRTYLAKAKSFQQALLQENSPYEFIEALKLSALGSAFFNVVDGGGSTFDEVDATEAQQEEADLHALSSEQERAERFFVVAIDTSYSGGSVITKDHLGTFFGADPMRISGGLVATFSMHDPVTGRIVTSGSITCRTTFARIRDIQSDSWAEVGKSGDLCRL